MPDNNKQSSFNEDQLRKAIRQLHPIREKISVIEADAADKRPLEDIWFDLLFLENELESILKRREPTPPWVQTLSQLAAPFPTRLAEWLLRTRRRIASRRSPHSRDCTEQTLPAQTNRSWAFS
jgi:hypothetical protein